MKDKVLIFGGTTEGRVLADILRKSGVPHEVSVATEYGKRIEVSSGEESIRSGRLSSAQIVKLLKSDEYLVVVDATHPFAIKASEDIKMACKEAGVEYLRLSRDTGDDRFAGATGSDVTEKSADDIVYVGNMAEAGETLDKIEGNILLMTGSKDLAEIVSKISDIERIYVRVLPSVESISLCEKAGITGKHIIAMQGPFSTEMNKALINECSAKVILTKESGRNGGYYEKLEAAGECDIKAVVVRNPERLVDETNHLGMRQVLEKLVSDYQLKVDTVSETDICLNQDNAEVIEFTAAGTKKEPVVVLAGIGPGNKNYRTLEVERALQTADIIFGAESVVNRVTGVTASLHPFYDAGRIIEYLKEHREYVSPVVVYSGDVSLSSGARKASERFAEAGYKVIKMSGISSVALFANRLGLSLEEVHVVSAHGRKCNVTGFVRQYEKLIVLPSDAADAERICREIYAISIHADSCEHDMKPRIIAGCDLGCDTERVIEISSEEAIKDGAKVLLYIENAAANVSKAVPSLRDDEIIRGEVPMTKEEIRALTMRKLELTPGSVFWDIGAGTGSISLEAALLHPEIEVYSYEKEEDALELLEKNRNKYGLSNMIIIPGEAPDSLDRKVIPSHVFIGGSGKKLKEIIELVTSLNHKVRVVLNCVTLETLSEVTELVKVLGLGDSEVTQVAVTRYNQRGKYHLADALNPVFIVSFGG